MVRRLFAAVVLAVGMATIPMAAPAVAPAPDQATAQATTQATAQAPAPIEGRAQAAARKAPMAVAPPTSTLGLLAIARGQEQFLGDVRRYRYVMLQHWFPEVVQRIHAVSPSTKVLAYWQASAVRVQDCGSGKESLLHVPYDSAPVNYCWVRVNRPQWLLRDTSGNVLRFADFPEYAAVDVANPEYQQMWLTNALALTRKYGYDGLYLDDIGIGPAHGMGGRIAKYSDVAFGSVMRQFASDVADRIRATGMLAIANVGANPWTPWQVDESVRLAPHLTTFNREFSMRWGGYGSSAFGSLFTTAASDGNPDLGSMTKYLRRLQAAGTPMSLMDYGHASPDARDLAAMQYGRAHFLLSWDGRPGSAYFFRNEGTSDPARPEWTTEVGAPTSPASLTSGVLQRSFRNGLVLLNPSSAATARFGLPANGSYLTVNGRVVRGTVTLPTRTALVLRRQASKVFVLQTRPMTRR